MNTPSPKIPGPLETLEARIDALSHELAASRKETGDLRQGIHDALRLRLQDNTRIRDDRDLISIVRTMRNLLLTDV